MFSLLGEASFSLGIKNAIQKLQIIMWKSIISSNLVWRTIKSWVKTANIKIASARNSSARHKSCYNASFDADWLREIIVVRMLGNVFMLSFSLSQLISVGIFHTLWNDTSARSLKTNWRRCYQPFIIRYGTSKRLEISMERDLLLYIKYVVL